MDLRRKGIFSLIIKIILSAVILGVAAFFTPGFSITGGFGTLAIAAVVVGLLSYAAVEFIGVKASPFGAGASGFLLTAVILYLTRYIVSGFSISFLGAILGALAIGVVDFIIPGRRFK